MGPMVKQWSDYKQYLEFLHALPYIMVLGLLFFTCFWMRGGVCCCCKGGTCTGFLLLPFLLLWLVNFVLFVIIAAVGVLVKFLSDDVPLDELKNKPTLREAISHMESAYPAFWNLVFAKMA